MGPKTYDTLSPSAAARFLGTTLNFIYQELWANRFPGALKVGKNWRIPVVAIEDRRKRRANSPFEAPTERITVDGSRTESSSPANSRREDVG